MSFSFLKPKFQVDVAEEPQGHGCPHRGLHIEGVISGPLGDRSTLWGGSQVAAVLGEAVGGDWKPPHLLFLHAASCLPGPMWSEAGFAGTALLPQDAAWPRHRGGGDRAAAPLSWSLSPTTSPSFPPSGVLSPASILLPFLTLPSVFSFLGTC